jgi:hypothetical protein
MFWRIFFHKFWCIFCRFFVNNLIGQGIFHGDQDFLSLNCPQCKKKCSVWHKNINILLFFKKIVILGFYAGKSHNLIGLGIFHGNLDFFDLHEKSLDRSNYEIFPHKILKSRTFKKSSILIVIMRWGWCLAAYNQVFKYTEETTEPHIVIPPPPPSSCYQLTHTQSQVLLMLVTFDGDQPLPPSLAPARVGMIFWADTIEKHGLAVLAYYTKKLQ